jgi:hypothetical protein
MELLLLFQLQLLLLVQPQHLGVSFTLICTHSSTWRRPSHCKAKHPGWFAEPEQQNSLQQKCDRNLMLSPLQDFTVLSTGSLLAVSCMTSPTPSCTPVDSWLGSAMPTARQTRTAQLPSQ